MYIHMNILAWGFTPKLSHADIHRYCILNLVYGGGFHMWEKKLVQYTTITRTKHSTYLSKRVLDFIMNLMRNSAA